MNIILSQTSMENQNQSNENPTRDLKKELTELEYQVTQEKKTEPPFEGEYYTHFEPGIYSCLVCNEKLFLSTTKYDSKSGWPSFYDSIEGQTEIDEDRRFGLPKKEVHCKKCKAHLGHVFPAPTTPTGDRYCVNSVSLKFVKQE